MKILLFATHPEQPVGYAKIGFRIANYLASQSDVELYYYAISNYPGQGVVRKIHPNIRIIDALAESRKRGQEDQSFLKEKSVTSSAIAEADPFAIDLAEEILTTVKPDMFIIYNDILVTCRLIQALQKYRQENPTTKFVSYIDLVLPFERPRYIRMIHENTDMIFAFSDFWKKNLIEMGIPAEKIHRFYHGIDHTIIYKQDPSIGRKKYNFQPDDFIVININRNQYRKAHDISISAFLQFLKRENMNPRIKLFINHALESAGGYDILELIETECIRQKLAYEDVTKKHIMHSSFRIGALEDEDINMIYNMSDVGINTCFGEGFGLCNAEHASVGKPQIVSAVGALRDIFEGETQMLVEPKTFIMIPNQLDDHSGDIHICDASDFADRLQYYFHHPEKCIEEGQRIANHINTKYDWDKLLPEFLQHLRSAIDSE
jgi:glycosyltransferase involved in cell wall biosynthesis